MRSNLMRNTKLSVILFALCLMCSLCCVRFAYADEVADSAMLDDDASTVVADADGNDEADGQVGASAKAADAVDELAATEVSDDEATVLSDDGDEESALEGGAEIVEEAVSEDASEAQSPGEASSDDAPAADEAVSAEGDPASTLLEGDYVIRTGLGGNYVLDVAGGSTANGGNVQIYTYNGTDAQKWRVSVDEAGRYTIANLKSGKILDLSGANAANGSNIHQYAANKSAAQQWLLSASGEGFIIKSAVNSKFALDITAGMAADGTNVQLWTANGTAAQLFIFSLISNGGATVFDTPLADGDYIIQSGVGSQYVVDVAGGSLSNGGNVQIYSYNGTKAQKWHVASDASGYYTITNIGSNKVLDLSGGSAWYGSNINQYGVNNTKAQKWIITEHNGMYKIASSVNPLFVIDVAGGAVANGANLQAYFDNGTNAQRFLFLTTSNDVPTSSDISDGVYAIASFSKNSFLVEVSGGSTANGANVQLYKDNDSNAQRWGVVRNSNGLYSVFNMTSGKMLDVSGGSLLSGANVVQYSSNDTKAQQWAIVKNASEGSFLLYSALSGMVLDISGGKIANGSNIQVYLPNGTAAQKFKFVAKPLIEERTYTIVSTLGSNLAVDVPGGSRNNGTALQVYTANDTLAQHVIVKDAGDGNVTMQVANSGKYLTASGSSVVQKTASSDMAQKWSASLVKGGILFTNASTGKALAVSSSKPKNGTTLTTASSDSATSKFGLRMSNIVSDGLYTFTSGASASGRVLDVSGGSWNDGANIQLYSANGSNAQKFLVKRETGNYYRIVMALAGKALDVAGGSTKEGANVNSYKWNGTDAQLWEPVVTDNGLTFVNKGSGLLLAVANGADKNGANVNQQAATNKYDQTWILAGTTVNAGDLTSIVNLVRAVPGSSNVTATWTVNESAWNGLMRALSNCWNAGYDVGFIATDIQTGHSISLNPDKTYYGACTIKAPYLTWVMERLVDPGYASLGHLYDRFYPAIHDSENSTYLSIRAEYGSDGFTSWLGEIGLSGGWTYENYAFYTPRTLQLMWTRLLAYEQSNGKTVGTWRSLFGDTDWTPLAYELRGNENIVYSKPGWYSGGGAYQTLSDSGIIVRPDTGNKYLLTIMATINPDSAGIKLEQGVARAIDTIMKTVPAV